MRIRTFRLMEMQNEKSSIDAADWIITNPPFSLAEAFIRRAAELGKPFAFLLKSQYWNATCRMKRIFITMAAVTVLLVGCSQTHYPYLRYKNSDADGDSKDRWIEVRDGHELSEGHSWDIIETDQGYDMVLHFVKTEGVR